MYPAFQPRKPVGIAVLAILQLIIGILDILTSVILLVAGATLGIIGFGISAAFAFMLIPVSILLFGLGAISFLLAYGLWEGRRWGWVWAIILAAVSLALGVLSLIGGEIASVATIVIDSLILIYLSTYNVRAYFGRVTTQVGYPRVGKPYRRGHSMQSPTKAGSPVSTCITCGNTISYGGNFCDLCGTRLR